MNADGGRELAAVHVGLEEGPSRTATDQAFAEETAGRDASLLVTLDDLVAYVSSVLRFVRREDCVLMILWAAQSWLGSGILPERCLAYLGFTGPKSSGKSTATEYACAIAGGTMIAGGSEAAIRSILNGDESGIPPRALGVDEIDIKAKQLPDLEGIFRTGNRWTAEYPIMVPKAKGRGWERKMLNVGGPKVFNYRSDPEDALASRTILIEMKPHADAGMIVRGLFEIPALERIRHVLMNRAKVAAGTWGARRLEDHMKKPEFIARVERLQANLPRGLQLGAVLLAIGDAMGFDAEAVIAQYVAEGREDSLESEREILREMLEKGEVAASQDVTGTGDVRIPNSVVHTHLNTKLRERGLPSVSVREWPRVRRELSVESVRHGRGLVLVFGPPARKALGLEGSAA